MTETRAVAGPGVALPMAGTGAHWESHVALTLLLALGVVWVMDSMIIGALLTPIKNHFGLGDEQAGRLSAAFTLAGIVGAPTFGYLANRYGRKPVLFSGVLVWSLASFASGWADGFIALLFWRALTGFGEAAYAALTPSWIADLYRPRWRNFVFSLYMVKNKVGSALALALGGWLAAEYGWRTAFYVAGAPGLLLAIGLLWQREPIPGESDGATARAPALSLRKGLAVFRHPGYLLHSVALVFFFIGMTAQIWIPAYLHRVYDIPNRQAAAFLAQVLLYTLPAGLIGGYLSSLWLRKYRWGFAAFLSATSVLAALAFWSAYTAADLVTTQWFIAGAIAAFGFSAGTLTTLIVETVPPHLRTSAASLAAVFTSGVSGIVGPEVIGLLSDAVGLKRAILVAPAAYFVASVVWLGLAVWLARRVDVPGSDVVPAAASPPDRLLGAAAPEGRLR
jgi:predicted MFS family arabinose efflux permease